MVENPGKQGPPAGSGGNTAEALYEELTRQNAKLIKMRYLASLVLLLVLAVYGSLIYTAFIDFDQHEFMNKLMDQGSRLAPIFSSALSDVVHDTSDEAMQRVRAVAARRTPKLKAKVRREADEMMTNLGERLRQRLGDALHQQFLKRREKIFTHFPELANDATRTKVLRNMDEVARRTVKEVVDEELGRCRRSIVSIRAVLDRPVFRSRIEMYKHDPQLRSKAAGNMLLMLSRGLTDGPPDRPMGYLHVATKTATPADAPAEATATAKASGTKAKKEGQQ